MECLYCNKSFKSENIKSNRLCALCKRRNKRKGRCFEGYPNHDVVVDPMKKIYAPKIPKQIYRKFKWYSDKVKVERILDRLELDRLEYSPL